MNGGPWKSGDSAVNSVTAPAVSETPFSKSQLWLLGMTLAGSVLAALFIVSYLVALAVFDFDVMEKIDVVKNALAFLKTVNGG